MGNFTGSGEVQEIAEEEEEGEIVASEDESGDEEVEDGLFQCQGGDSIEKNSLGQILGPVFRPKLGQTF